MFAVCSVLASHFLGFALHIYPGTSYKCPNAPLVGGIYLNQRVAFLA